jgi:hypothetical protein
VKGHPTELFRRSKTATFQILERVAHGTILIVSLTGGEGNASTPPVTPWAAAAKCPPSKPSQHATTTYAQAKASEKQPEREALI